MGMIWRVLQEVQIVWVSLIVAFLVCYKSWVKVASSSRDAGIGGGKSGCELISMKDNDGSA